MSDRLTRPYNPSQAARVLEVSRRTIYRWIESGKLMPVFHVGHPRIPREQIQNIRLGIP
jgi:excisionase family DNA binding protein